MQKPALILQALFMALSMIFGTNVSVAAEQAQAAIQSKEQVYGSQLMTREELAEHRAKMRNLKTNEEREAFRMEHHKKMQERAERLGKTLPDMPPAQGCGPGCMGAGCGSAGCAGSGQTGAGY